MTYDLHGQWDYGNVNAFDSCPSGKCIRSHVNLTETRNALSLVTKAGVPNNKIFVGESSYGRSFHMAVDGCWGPNCDFTGSRTVSDAREGRCTKTAGDIANAEIDELIRLGGAEQLHDGGSNTDMLLYKGDAISYMTPTTKDTRRADWKTLNFAGSIDWAVDLQAFGRDDFDGPVVRLPSEVSGENIAWDELDVDLNRLCKFACQYGYCPQDICTTPVIDADQDGIVEVGNDPDNPNWYDTEAARRSGQVYAPGKCSCDNYLLNVIADTIIEALPIIAEIGCYIVMSALKTVLDIGLEFIPGVGKILDSGLDAAAVAAQVASYAYPEEEDPEGAFSWWLSPCGGTDLVPDDIKNVFDILSNIADGVSSFKTPKNIKKGSGRKGDDANPVDRSKPKAGTGKGPNGTGNGNSNGVKKKCRVPPAKSTTRLGPAKNTLREQSCVADKTQKDEMIITSIAYGSRQTQVAKPCSKSWSQACFHYSSAVSRNPSWATLTCPPAAGATAYERPRPAVKTWYNAQHQGGGWKDPANRQQLACDADEYPPAYLLDDTSPAFINSGLNAQGQSIRYLPDGENRGAGSMWKGACFSPHVAALSDSDVRSKRTYAEVSVNVKPEFTISSWGQQGIAAGDPGFALLSFDPWYNGKPHPYDYTKDYEKGANGS
ncbi:hypothetical protein ONZ43_g2151 [Nemania bipapillata]|uniref:Uncharacterized protein n=1 Tax=Nemania bipapillata TaxID=110536 RepID=A0ACC2J213_9PEZI|nr:hypothetical protein ONZ43_g2151 [Nemania bipapillata]